MSPVFFLESKGGKFIEGHKKVIGYKKTGKNSRAFWFAIFFRLPSLSEKLHTLQQEEWEAEDRGRHAE